MVAANAVLFFFVASEIHGTLSKAPETEQKRKENSKEMRVLISIFVTVGLSWIFGFFISLVSTVFVLYQIVNILFTVTAPLQVRQYLLSFTSSLGFVLTALIV